MPARFGQTDGDLAGLISQMGGYITKAVNDRMEAAMTQVRDETVKRVPVDHGNMEQAIKLQKSDQRRSWIVYVDEDMPAWSGPSGRPYTVGEYATWLHEAVYNLGPKSLAKGVPNNGRKYLENPFREIINANLMSELDALLKSEIAKRSRR